MPGELDGFGLARWVMAHHPETPVILVSGDFGKANAATELFGVELLSKPYEFQTIAKIIMETIGNYRQRHT